MTTKKIKKKDLDFHESLLKVELNIYVIIYKNAYNKKEGGG